MKKRIIYIGFGLLLACLLLIANLFSPLKVGKISTCILEMYSTGDRLLLPVEYGLLTKLPHAVEFLNSREEIVGRGQISSILNTGNSGMRKRGNLTVNFNFVAQTGNNEGKVEELHMIYDDKVISYHCDNIRIIKRFKDDDYTSSGIQVTMSVEDRPPNDEIVVILTSIGQEAIITNIGALENVLKSTSTFPMHIAKSDGNVYLPLAIPIPENQFIVLKPIIYTKTGSTGMTLVIPPVNNPEYIKGVHFKHNE